MAVMSVCFATNVVVFLARLYYSWPYNLYLLAAAWFAIAITLGAVVARAVFRRGRVTYHRIIGARTFRLSTLQCVDVARGLALLFGLGTKALPVWDSKTRWNNLWVDLAVRLTAGSSGRANSPHPSSREGHHSTTQWSSSFLLIID